MRIGINALGLKPASCGGMEIYFRNLIKALCETDKENENEYYVFLNDKEIKETIQQNIGLRVKIIYISQFYTYFTGAFFILFTRPSVFIKLLINKFSRVLSIGNIYEVDIDMSGVYGKIVNLDSYKMDVIHFPFTIIDPSFLNIKTPIVLTIPDIQQEYYPEFFNKSELNMRKKLYKPSAERADIILTISETTKKTLIEKYGIKPEKIIVSYPGCSRDFKKIEDQKTLSAVKEKYALPDEFIFYPASTWLHKNHIKLLAAISILKKKYDFEKKLVLTGIPMNNHSRIIDTIKRLNLEKQVIFLHFIPFSDIPVIYNLAAIMVFPSLFEGFGIPLLEAMNAGLPITCSDRTSIPEIVGDAGIYFNPDIPEDIAEKIFLLWHSNDMKKELIRKGFERAALSKWKETAEKTLSAYNHATNLVR